MMRNILLAIFAAAVVGAMIFGYIYLKRSNQPQANVYQAIPASAVAVLQSPSPLATWRKLAHNSIFWEELTNVEAVMRLTEHLTAIDTLIQQQPDLQELAEEHTWYLSIHGSQAKELELLLALPLPGTFSESELLEFLQALSGSSPEQVSQEIPARYRFQWNGAPFDVAFAEGILLLSSKTELLQQSLEQLKQRQGIWAQADFREVHATAGNTVNGNLFVRFSRVSHLLGPLLSDASYRSLQTKAVGFSGWTATDIDLKSNEVMWSGFTAYNDSIPHVLSLWEKQKPQDYAFVSVVPENCAAFVHMGTSHFAGWYERYRRRLERENRLKAYDERLASTEDSLGWNIEQNMLNWVEHELAFGYLEPRSALGGFEPFAVLKTANPDLARERLTALTQRDRDPQEGNIPPEADYPILPLQAGALFAALFDDAFAPMEANYVLFMDRYVVFTASEEAARTFVNHYVAERTLNRDPGFQLLQENIAEESNLFLYTNVARAAQLLVDQLDPALQEQAEELFPLFRKFQAFTLQWTFERPGLFYAHGYALHNPIYKEKAHTLWELALEAPARIKPVIVTNHYTGAREVVVQDEENTLYLISSTGKLLWKKPLPGPILGSVQQMDAYRNDKLQLVFNTAEQLFLVDRNGKDVSGFPKTFEAPATCAMTLLDYTSSRNYRILIPLSNGDLLNLDNLGEEVTGWRYRSSGVPVVAPVRYAVVRGRDYLLAVDSAGQVTGYDRRGRTRLKGLESTLPAYTGILYELIPNHSLSTSYLLGSDSLGSIFRLFLDDRLEREDFGTFHALQGWLYGDLNLDGTSDYVFVDTARIQAFNNNQDLLFEYALPNGTYTRPYLYRFNETAWIGVANTKTDALFLVDRTGTLHPGFPLKGSSEFTITDLNNDGSLNLLVSDSSGLLYNYLLEHL